MGLDNTLVETTVVLLMLGLVFVVGFRVVLSRAHLVRADDHSFVCEFYLRKHEGIINDSYVYLFSLPKQLATTKTQITVDVYLLEGKTLVPLTTSHTLTSYLYLSIPKKTLPLHISRNARCRLIIAEQNKLP